jgi:hypothetical protein
MPRAYWLDQDHIFLTSLLLLIEPSKAEFDRVIAAISEAGPDDYDMEILNRLYKDSALVLPHRPLALLTGEFRSKSHVRYLGSAVEDWDPTKILAEAKLVHFSDWPIPKVCLLSHCVMPYPKQQQPWIAADYEMIQSHQPTCDFNLKTGQDDDCRSRVIWLGLYRDFADHRKVDVPQIHNN